MLRHYGLIVQARSKEGTVAPTQEFAPVEALVGRLLESAVGGIDILSIYLGEQLGYYRALDQLGPMTASELAAKTGTNERYTREWLEQQATTQFIAVDSVEAAEDERRYSLPDGYAEVFVNELSPAFVAPIGRFLKVMGTSAGPLLAAYQSGTGISWSEMGDDARNAQADFNRPFFLGSLVSDYLAQLPELHEALKRQDARVAEIGPGGGWALVALARAYPELRGDGFELDGPSVALAMRNLADAGVADRFTVHHQNAAAAPGQGEYDLVAALECIHDMSDPVGVLSTMRRLAKPYGTVLVVDERVADEFGAFGDLIERFFYGASLFICLPDGMSGQPTAATGTVMRTSKLREYALEAGFVDIEVLPLEHDLFRFYRLVQ